jgi:hypothetical protein
MGAFMLVPRLPFASFVRPWRRIGSLRRTLSQSIRLRGQREPVDCSLNEIDRPLYRVWLHSPSVFGGETETILAYKIAKEIHAIPSRVLKALRGLPEVDPALQRRVDDFVENDDSLTYAEGDTARRIALAIIEEG